MSYTQIMVPTKKIDSNSTTFEDFFSLFPELFASKFFDFSLTFDEILELSTTFMGVVRIATIKFLSCKIKTYIL